MCQKIDEINFWQMRPEYYTYTHEGSSSIFHHLHPDFRVLVGEQEYVLGTNQAHSNILANLPDGTWQVTQLDMIAQQEKQLATDARDKFTFDAPDSRAVLFHFKKVD